MSSACAPTALHLAAAFLAAHLLLTCCTVKCAVTPITVDFSRRQDVPLLKKYAIYNSGIIGQERYTPEILESMGTVKASSLRIDLSIGKQSTGFTDLMTGQLDPKLHTLDFRFDLIDTLAEGLHAQKVMPYWGLSYNPVPFQPTCPGGVGSSRCNNATTTCLGFESQAAVPGTNNYTCVPTGAALVDDCWKCPPKSPDGSGYEDWAQMVAYFHSHFLQKNITPLYEEHWNEPDLTEYYNPTLSAYKGSNTDANEAFLACATEMLAEDPDLVFGGISVANQIRHNPKFPLQPTNEDTLLALAAAGLPMAFFTYHSITTQLGIDQVQLLIDRAQISREVLTGSLVTNVTGELNPYLTTEIHCNEFWPNSTKDTVNSAYAGSAHLATLLLETWLLLLDETDLTTVHWAQYMDVFNTSDQIGLIDYWGHPRPAWWAFRWYGELPVERVSLEVESPYVHGVAGYSARECAAGVLLWNTPAPVGGRAQEEATVAVTMRNVPFSRFTIEAYIIDDRRHPSGGYDYSPAMTFEDQAADQDGTYLFPWTAYVGLKVPINGTIYLKLVPGSSCVPAGNFRNPLPEAQLLRTHHYYGYRPYKTSSYAHFHPRDWSAFLGMGSESDGFLITGLTARATGADVFNISMAISDGEIDTGGAAGVRVDFSTQLSGREPIYQRSASYFFYQTGTTPCATPGYGPSAGTAPAALSPPALDLSAGIPATAPEAPQGITSQAPVQPSTGSDVIYASQSVLSSSVSGRKLLQTESQGVCGSTDEDYVQIPALWGTQADVPHANFIPTDLADFKLPLQTFAPVGWDGRVLLLFVLKDATPGTRAQVHITQQPPGT